MLGLTDGDRALTHGINAERWRKALEEIRPARAEKPREKDLERGDCPGSKALLFQPFKSFKNISPILLKRIDLNHYVCSTMLVFFKKEVTCQILPIEQ